MSLLFEVSQALLKAQHLELAAGDLARVWRNKYPILSFAFRNGDPEESQEITRKKKALQKSWPELAELLDEVIRQVPRR